MSAIEGINSDTALSYLSNEESGKRASDQQEGQMAIMVQTMMSSFIGQMSDTLCATSDTSADSTSTEPSSSTTTDTTTTTEDETNSTVSNETTDSTDSSSSSDGPTQQQQMAFKLGESFEQMLTGVSSAACENQSSQDGDQTV
ncbi:MAG: hypothetical protein KFB95_09165 [Simkaniaceae bacterium]|nr:MAG: hypothetical protein KFB95_09165 [Simkaniaceae bacterium]